MRRIYAVHQWVSLICALFLLLLTLTGLPLLFRGEISAYPLSALNHFTFPVMSALLSMIEVSCRKQNDLQSTRNLSLL